MRLLKTIVSRPINSQYTDFEEVWLPENTKEGTSVIIKSVDSSQAFRVVTQLNDESIIIDGNDP